MQPMRQYAWTTSDHQLHTSEAAWHVHGQNLTSSHRREKGTVFLSSLGNEWTIATMGKGLGGAQPHTGGSAWPQALRT